MKKDEEKNIGAKGYLELEHKHKDWYEVGAMGKQRGKPKAIQPKVKKQKGQFKKLK